MIIRKIRNSVFTKMLIVFVISGLAIHILFGIFFKIHFLKTNHKNITSNFLQYSEYIVKDVGIPPDVNKAREIAFKTSLFISIAGPELKWESSKQPEFCKNRPKRKIKLADNLFWCRGHFLYQKNIENYTFTIISSYMPISKDSWKGFLFFVFLVLLVMLLTYLIIRRTLKPIRVLHQGVKKITGGSIDFKIPVTSNNELGQLSSSFNKMVKQINEMLKSKEQLFRDISHELRSPLTRMKVNLELMDNLKVKNNLSADIIEMEKLINTLLENEKVSYLTDKLSPEVINVNNLISDLIEKKKADKKKIKISNNLKKFFIYADYGLIKIVFDNILENALKYSDVYKNPIDIDGLQLVDKIIINIKDYGAGIPSEDLPYVFEPFYKVDKARSHQKDGYGLGLNISQKIMLAHKGKIEISSQIDEGTVVSLIFPIN